MSWLRGVLRDLREGKRPRLRLAIYLAIYAIIVAFIVAGMDAVVASGAPEWTKYLVLLAGLVPTWFVANWEIGPSTKEPDPFGRNTLTGIRHELRARQQTATALNWDRVAGADLPAPIRDAFVKLDMPPEVHAASGAWIWVAAERDWHGWPDPPRFVVLGFDASGRLGASVDLDTWPASWTKPADWPFEPKPAETPQ